jgi:hypothetical protein
MRFTPVSPAHCFAPVRFAARRHDLPRGVTCACAGTGHTRCSSGSGPGVRSLTTERAHILTSVPRPASTRCCVHRPPHKPCPTLTFPDRLLRVLVVDDGELERRGAHPAQLRRLALRRVQEQRHERPARPRPAAMPEQEQVPARARAAPRPSGAAARARAARGRPPRRTLSGVRCGPRHAPARPAVKRRCPASPASLPEQQHPLHALAPRSRGVSVRQHSACPLSAGSLPDPSPLSVHPRAVTQGAWRRGQHAGAQAGLAAHRP